MGRVARDGQLDVVTAYFLIAEVGSDPIICDVLGIKKSQLFGTINPNAPLVEKLQIDPHHVRRLAENYLAQVGRVKKK